MELFCVGTVPIYFLHRKVPKSSIVKIVIIIRHEEANLKDTYNPINTKSYIILHQKVLKTFFIKLEIVNVEKFINIHRLYIVIGKIDIIMKHKRDLRKTHTNKNN